MILTRSTRLSQPQSPVGLDISHPLAKYLTVWASPQFTQRGSTALSPLARIGDVPNKSGPSGVGWDFSATGENRVLLQSADRPSVAGNFYIVAARFKWNSTAAWGTIFGLYTGTAYVFTIARWSNGSLRLHTGGGDVFTSGARYLENGKDYTVVMTVCGSSGLAGEAYINGQYVGKGTPANPVSTTRAPCIGALDATTGYEYNDLIYGAAIFDHGPDRPSPEWLRSLSANPWQLFRPVQRRIYFDMVAGGGTTPVSSDQSATYSIRGAVSSDQAASYAIRSSVSADLSASYNIQTASAVSSDLSSGYEILAAAQADAAAAYIIRASVQADSSADYAIRSSVQADAGAAFFVRGVAASDATAAYLLRGSTSSDLSAAYEIQTASGVGASLDASYNVRAAVQSDASAAYDLRTAVGATSEHAFMVRGLVSSDLDASFTVEAPITQVYADLQAAYLVDGGAVFIPSQFVASVPAGVFSARSPAGEYSATVPAGIFKASI